jgi:FkbM family methyltransferase
MANQMNYLINQLKDFAKIFASARWLYPRFYSQTGEDMILNQMLGKRKGVYVDIGSGYPIWCSNTYFLYRRGWSGVLVDPIRRNITYSKILRPRDKAILGAVSKNDGEGIFYEFENYAYSTLDPTILVSRLAAGLKLRATYTVQLISFESLVSKFPRESLMILSIDTEGQELEILQSINFKVFSPAIILVEELVSPLITSTIRERMSELGYTLHAFTGFTSIYRNASFESY